MAKMCARFIMSLFACPDVAQIPAPNGGGIATSSTLAVFIAYALHRTRLHPSVVVSALYLLSRLKSRFPLARGSSGHRLFISAYMIASKVICDDTYSNKSWCIVSQQMFSIKEINQMEREMCSYLEWVLNVEQSELDRFESRLKKEFGASGSGNIAGLLPPSPTPAKEATKYVPATVATAPSTSKSATPNPPPIATRPTIPATSSSSSLSNDNDSYPSPPDSTAPSPSLSDNTSPASSICLTPPSTENHQAAIASSTTSLTNGSSSYPITYQPASYVSGSGKISSSSYYATHGGKSHSIPVPTAPPAHVWNPGFAAPTVW
jgi:hypothetical protein